MLPVVALMTGDWMLGAAVALAVLAASTIATVVALALPWLLHHLGKDPGFGSSHGDRDPGPLTIGYFLAVTALLA